MASKYIYQFNIHDIFKTTDEQKIFIGSFKEDNSKFVIINILNVQRFLQQEVKEQLQLLNNLVYFEELNEGIVLVTSFKKSQYLAEYVKNNTLTIEEGLNLAYQYLKGIVKYDGFSNDIKHILIDESQITIKEGNILFNELLFLEDGMVDYDHSFKRVAQSVAAVLKTIVCSNISITNVQSNVLDGIVEFIKDLEQGDHEYTNFHEILRDFQFLYRGGSYNSHHLQEVSKLLEEDNYNSYKKRQPKKQQNHTFIKATIATAVVGVAIAVLALGIGDRSKTGDSESNIPMAYFEENQIDNHWEFINNSIVFGDDNKLKEFLWEVRKEDNVLNQYSSKDLSLSLQDEGRYEIALRVKDANSNWSEEFSRVIRIIEEDGEGDDDLTKPIQSSHVIENFEKYDVFYPDSDIVTTDDTIFRSGEYALKFLGTFDHLSKDIFLNNVNIQNNGVLSLWIMTDGFEDIKMEFQGYNSDDDLKFQHAIDYSAKVIGQWEMIYFDIPIEGIIKIKTAVLSSNTTVWIDDIKIDSYK